MSSSNERRRLRHPWIASVVGAGGVLLVLSIVSEFAGIGLAAAMLAIYAGFFLVLGLGTYAVLFVMNASSGRGRGRNRKPAG